MLKFGCSLLALVAVVNGACKLPFIQIGEGCYYFSYKDDLKMSWPEARTHCQNLVQQADLAVFDYLCQDYMHVANYLLGEEVHTPIEAMYIGADGFDASWLWVDGRALSPHAVYWYEKNPTDAAGCVFLLPAKPHAYERIFMSKNLCTQDRYFVCQADVHARR